MTLIHINSVYFRVKYGEASSGRNLEVRRQPNDKAGIAFDCRGRRCELEWQQLYVNLHVLYVHTWVCFCVRCRREANQILREHYCWGVRIWVVLEKTVINGVIAESVMHRHPWGRCQPSARPTQRTSKEAWASGVSLRWRLVNEIIKVIIQNENRVTMEDLAIRQNRSGFWTKLYVAWNLVSSLLLWISQWPNVQYVRKCHYSSGHSCISSCRQRRSWSSWCWRRRRAGQVCLIE